MWYVHFFFPRREVEGEKMEMCLKVRDFSFPNMFVAGIGRQYVSYVNMITSCDPQWPALLYTDDHTSLIGWLWGPDKIVIERINTSKNRIQIIFSVIFIILKKICSDWELRHWGPADLGLNLGPGSIGSVAEHKLYLLYNFSFLICKMGYGYILSASWCLKMLSTSSSTS